MITDCVHPISTVSARDILKDMIRKDMRFLQYPQPTIYDARHMAKLLNEEHPLLFVDPGYLLSVWQELYA